ncbi:DUF4136 domain-containing protein [Pontibacter burrus]|uniref:DUF4136 domain-containing protein n=1 Tax=Pontibacter burrus TaxID=2704466 RepID=A0A6B3LLS4_9BACT|nr:DUF4136 domain-containing protein [Pontibacter burrus]NEM96903.1 DUF4136 domain-containing protein [Pontibacter burrus]
MKATIEKLCKIVWVWMLPLLLTGCASSTRITGTWKSPEATSTYNNIVVAALTENILARQKVETDMQNQLRQHGVNATRSMDIFPPARSSKNGPDVNLLLEKMRNDNYDAVLTVALVDEETQTRYVPGNVGYRPVTTFAWYGNFRRYYTYWYPIMYDPGYYTEDKVYFLETNLYNVKDDNLLWSAQSRSYSPSSMRKAAEKLAEITINQLATEGLIHAQANPQ